MWEDGKQRRYLRMHKNKQILILINDIDTLYVSKNEEGRWLANIEDSVDASMRGLEDNIKKS